MNQQGSLYRHQNPIETTPVSSKRTNTLKADSSFEASHMMNISTPDEHRNKLARTTARQSNRTTLEEQHPTATREQRRAGNHNCQPTLVPYKKERRPSEAMCTLKTELATLKEEIGKLMTLDGKMREDQQRGQSFGNSSTRNSRKVVRQRETASMSHSVLYHPNSNDLSFLVRQEQEAPSNEKVHYILLENESLKLQLKNLKIRYVQRKAELKDEIHCLQLKVDSLQSMMENEARENTAALVQGREDDRALIESLKEEISRIRSDDLASKLSTRSKEYDRQLAAKEASLCIMKEELDSVRKDLESKEGLIRELKTSVQEIDSRRNEHIKLSEFHYKRELDNIVRHKDAQIEQLSQISQAQGQQLRELTTKQSNVSYSVEALRKEIHNKDLMLSQLDYEKRLLTESNRDRVDQLERLVDSLKQELQMSEAKLGECSRIVHNQQQQINNFVNHHSDSHAVEIALKSETQRLQTIMHVREKQFKDQMEHQLSENNRAIQAVQTLSAKIMALEHSLQSANNALKAGKTENGSLRENIRSLTAEIDTLNSSHHRSEQVTEALNRSVKHYEDKISQLRADYEQQILQIAHSSSEAHKMLDQKNALLRQKETQVTQLREELDKEHRLAEQATASSRKMSSEYEQLEINIKSKEQANQKLKEMVDGLKLQLESLRNDNQRQGEELYRVSSLSDRSQKQSSLLREQEGIIEQLQRKINQLENSVESVHRESSNHLINLQKLENCLKEKDRQICRKDQEIANLNIALRQRVTQLNDERDRWRRADRTSEQSKVIATLEHQLKQQARDYDEIIAGLKLELQHRQREDLSRSRSSRGDIGSIDEAMKSRDEEISTLRQSLSQRNSELERLQSLLSQTKSEMDNLKRQYGVDRVRSISERNSSQTVVEIEIMNLKSDLNIERKTNESALQKLKYLNEESRKKDAFIQNFLIGKKLGSQEQLDLKEFFACYEKEFPRETIHTRLFNEIRELQRLGEHIRFLQNELGRSTVSLPTNQGQ